MSGLGRFLLTTVPAVFSLGVLVAQEHQHEGMPPEQLGKVHFATSCTPAVAAKFDRAVALLHSFWFPAAIDAFHAVLQDDPNCGIAYWGIALSQWGNPFGGSRTPKVLEDGWATVQKGISVGAKTQRERDYIAAAGELYRDAAAAEQRARTLNYEKAMAQLAGTHPDDSEAQIFYALSLDATALPTDKTYANQLKAAAILEKAFAEQPDHPGVAHYIIHSYDVPALAPRALKAARRYAAIAPSAPHALHMPSHTFTRVGQWESSIATNIKSAESARKANSPGEVLHALDYMAYAYLQTAQDRAARRVLDEMEALAQKAEKDAFYGPAGAFALAAIPARNALERGDWAAARTLVVRPVPAAPFTDAMTRFARALGFARSGDAASAQVEITELAKLRDALLRMKDAYWAGQVEIERLAASAWAARAEGKKDEALSLMRSAAEQEDATEKSAVTPGPIKPAREQLGELLLAFEQPGPALKEFEATLTKEPRRFRAVYGAAHAAQLAGDRTKTRSYYRQLVEICRQADTERPELLEARQAAGGAASR